MNYLKHYINGNWQEGTNHIKVENPYNQEVLAMMPRGAKPEVDQAASAAKEAFFPWMNLGVEKRIEYVEKIYSNILARKNELAVTVTNELGSSIKVSRETHVDPFLNHIRHFLDLAKNFEYEERRPYSIVRYEPIGVVGALTPWNFPFCQVVKKVIPALLAGDCIILKPSKETPLTSLIMTECIDEAGLPAGVYNMVLGVGSEVGDALALHPDVDMISFTGSTNAGREVSIKSLSNIKKISLELGGKSPAIALPGANKEMAAKAVLNTVIPNSGQTCNALTRLLVPREELADYEKVLIDQSEKYVSGQPFDPEVDIVTMVSKKLYDQVRKYILIGIEEGARLILGSVPQEESGNGKGYYIAPTIFSDVSNDMRISREEIFGPVLTVTPYDTVDQAIEIANDTIYGLCGAVFGEADQAKQVATQIRTGTLFLNEAEGDFRAPFGGYKQSGLGREGGLEGFVEFMEVKSLYL